MIGLGIAGAVTSLLGTAASGIGSLIANRREDERLNREQNLSNAHYDRLMSQDPTRRSENATVMSQLDRKLKTLNENAEAKNTILGATPEMSIAQRQASADAYSDALSNLASLASQRVDLLNDQKYQANQRYNDIRRNIEGNRMQNWENLANNAAQLGASAMQTINLAEKTPSAGAVAKGGMAQNIKTGEYIDGRSIGVPKIPNLQ